MMIKAFHVFDNGQHHFQRATLRDRIIAQLIDGIILGVLTSLILALFSRGQLYSVWISPMMPVYLLQVVNGYVQYLSDWWWGGYYIMINLPFMASLKVALPSPLQWCYYAIYYSYFHSIYGQTPGKMMKGLVVLDRSKQIISFQKSIGRWAGYIISMIPLGMGFWVFSNSRMRETWHDRLVDTQVYRFINTK